MSPQLPQTNYRASLRHGTSFCSTFDEALTLKKKKAGWEGDWEVEGKFCRKKKKKKKRKKEEKKKKGVVRRP